MGSKAEDADQIAELRADWLEWVGRLRFEEPARSSFINPFDDSRLLQYYHDLARWHGFVRFIGLPQLKDNPDLALSGVFVEPYLVERAVSLDAHPREWLSGARLATEAVAASPRLVILGDPGSGKSTLLSWLTVQLIETSGS